MSRELQAPGRVSRELESGGEARSHLQCSLQSPKRSHLSVCWCGPSPLLPQRGNGETTGTGVRALQGKHPEPCTIISNSLRFISKIPKTESVHTSEALAVFSQSSLALKTLEAQVTSFLPPETTTSAHDFGLRCCDGPLWAFRPSSTSLSNLPFTAVLRYKLLPNETRVCQVSNAAPTNLANSNLQDGG